MGDRTPGKEMMAPANYPSQNRMRKYADLSIPHTMLMLMSDDEEVEVDGGDKITAPGTETPPTSETPLQDSEVSSTTNDPEVTTSSTSHPVTVTVPTVSVTHSTRNRDTIVTTTTTIISRRKRTSSDLDADDESAPELPTSSSSGDENVAERVSRHTPKRKKSDADNAIKPAPGSTTSSEGGGEMTPGGSKRRSKRLIENKT